ncbi:DNA repair protein RecO [Bifidobacterium sp.]|uniref:DNA repair protein RecO n=1 Tax=Bifidobacterium sp. TaxID=41200 RepID=UPI0025C34508|nr:DNA repair protein RecO [Bifidobacterium sp.]MCI1636168.1 DNA repair protein RecO [Bifidobacterium sp.]
MVTYRDEAVVLTTVKLGEADRIITLLSREHGKIRAVAKGVRRTKSKFGARLEPFMRTDVLIAEGRTLDRITQAASIMPYADLICGDYDLYTNGSVILETINKLLSSEHESAKDQYSLLVAALASLSRHRHRPELISASYVMRSLALAGWFPRCDSCVVCGRREGLDFFSVPAGGVMCSNDRTPEARRISAHSCTVLNALVHGDWSVLDVAGETAEHGRHGERVAIDPLCARIVEEWGEYYLERPIRSLRLLDS